MDNPQKNRAKFIVKIAVIFLPIVLYFITDYLPLLLGFFS